MKICLVSVGSPKRQQSDPDGCPSICELQDGRPPRPCEVRRDRDRKVAVPGFRMKSRLPGSSCQSSPANRTSVKDLELLESGRRLKDGRRSEVQAHPIIGYVGEERIPEHV